MCHVCSLSQHSMFLNDTNRDKLTYGMISPISVCLCFMFTLNINKERVSRKKSHLWIAVEYMLSFDASGGRIFKNTHYLRFSLLWPAEIDKNLFLKNRSLSSVYRQLRSDIKPLILRLWMVTCLYRDTPHFSLPGCALRTGFPCGSRLLWIWPKKSNHPIE